MYSKIILCIDLFPAKSTSEKIPFPSAPTPLNKLIDLRFSTEIGTMI